MREPLDILRELAKNDYYQSLYSSAKELGLQLFENTSDLTRIQLWFLSYMSLYSVINMDIALGEISDRVLENVIYEDAYMLYKKKTNIKDVKTKLHSKPTIKPKNNESDVVVSPKSTWLFKKPKAQ